MDAYWGAKKIIFLIRDIDGPAMAGRVGGILSIAARRLPRSLGVGWTWRKRLAACGASMRQSGLMPDIGHDLPKERSRDGKAQVPTHAHSATTRPQTCSRSEAPRADRHPKKVNNLDPMAPYSPKTAITRGPPVVAVAVSFGPYTTPPIVNYKYRTSTP